MNNLLNQRWFILSLNGILAIIFGLIAIIFPTITLIGLAIYFAITIVVGGASSIYSSLKFKDTLAHWQWALLHGILSVIIGILILTNPQAAAALFLTLIGAWVLIIGALFLITHYRTKERTPNSRFFLFNGIISLLFGLIIIANPFEGSRVITVIIGIFAMAYGIISLAHNSKTK